MNKATHSYASVGGRGRLEPHEDVVVMELARVGQEVAVKVAEVFATLLSNRSITVVWSAVRCNAHPRSEVDMYVFRDVLPSEQQLRDEVASLQFPSQPLVISNH